MSPACDHCYAESVARRYGHHVWGPGSTIRVLSEQHWQEPIRWNEAARRAGERHRVFCASMADVFEGTRVQAPLRSRLWQLVERTQGLDWLLLTKRPGKVRQLVPWTGQWPSNVWIGTTVENQEWAERRLPQLCAVPAVTRFVSVEPLLGHVDLLPFLRAKPGIDWVIVGGESGASARPTNPEWIRAIRDQCARRGVPFFFKQWGTWGPQDATQQSVASTSLIRIGKKRAGRILDGRTWDQFPVPSVDERPFLAPDATLARVARPPRRRTAG